MDNRDYNLENIPADEFVFANSTENLHDKKLKTKQMSYFQDVFNRFAKINLLLLRLLLSLFSYCLQLSDHFWQIRIM